MRGKRGPIPDIPEDRQGGGSPAVGEAQEPAKVEAPPETVPPAEEPAKPDSETPAGGPEPEPEEVAPNGAASPEPERAALSVMPPVKKKKGRKNSSVILGQQEPEEEAARDVYQELLFLRGKQIDQRGEQETGFCRHQWQDLIRQSLKPALDKDFDYLAFRNAMLQVAAAAVAAIQWADMKYRNPEEESAAQERQLQMFDGGDQPVV